VSVGTLWVIASPIGNLEDISLRALRLLGEVAVVACEDTRTTRKLLDRHGIKARTLSCHEHNEARRAKEIAGLLVAGSDVAYITDAGTPLISDPGRRLVDAARAAGTRGPPVPGASAVMAALMASGLDARRFTFFGFPPARGRARQSFLDDVVAATCTTILFEAPHRIERTLRELAERAPGRSASLHRELTKLHEETRSGTLAELAADVGTTRGEFTLIVAGPEPKPAGTVEEALAQARTLLAEGVAPSAAARQAASAVRVGRRDVYRRLVDERKTRD